jgi:hypothetical protein
MHQRNFDRNLLIELPHFPVSNFDQATRVWLGTQFGGMIGTILLDDLRSVEKFVSLEGNLVEGDCGGEP